MLQRKDTIKKAHASDNYYIMSEKAESLQYMGRRGYLATITSAEENNFMFNYFCGEISYLGGSFSNSTKYVSIFSILYYCYIYLHYVLASLIPSLSLWTWTQGPEKGEVFYNTTATNCTKFCNWMPRQPDSPEREYLLGFTPYYKLNLDYCDWNDYADLLPSGAFGPSTIYYNVSYIVEFSFCMSFC